MICICISPELARAENPEACSGALSLKYYINNSRPKANKGKQMPAKLKNKIRRTTSMNSAR